MDKATVATLVAYNFWANRRILAACARISEAAAILTGYGQSPGELDFDEFLKKCPDHMHG